MKNRMFTIIFMAVSFTVVTTANAEKKDTVWVCNQECPKPTKVVLKVLLDGKAIYSTSLSICKWEREFEDGKFGFRFTPTRQLVWYGYRSDEGDGKEDPGDPSPAGDTLDVHFWQAGGEINCIILGYIVYGDKAPYMNSLHILSPYEKSTTTMAPGLILETWPE